MKAPLPFEKRAPALKPTLFWQEFFILQSLKTECEGPRFLNYFLGTLCRPGPVLGHKTSGMQPHAGGTQSLGEARGVGGDTGKEPEVW